MAIRENNGSGSKPATKKVKPLSWKINPLPAATQYVNSVAISSDGSKVIAGTYYFDYSRTGHSLTGKLPFTVGVFAYNKSQSLLWKDEFPVSEGVYWVALSRDGAWAASGGLEMHGQGFISVYDATNGHKAINYKISARTNMVARNNDGSYMIAGSGALYVFSRNGANWNVVPQIIHCIQPLDTIISVGISGDGSYIIAGTLKGTVMLIKNSGGVLERLCRGNFQAVSTGSRWLQTAQRLSREEAAPTCTIFLCLAFKQMLRPPGSARLPVAAVAGLLLFLTTVHWCLLWPIRVLQVCCFFLGHLVS